MTALAIDHEVGNIGRLAIIVLKQDGRCYLGNVLDQKAGTTIPKRIRIQYDPNRQGDVVQPHEYEFKEWADNDE